MSEAGKTQNQKSQSNIQETSSSQEIVSPSLHLLLAQFDQPLERNMIDAFCPNV